MYWFQAIDDQEITVVGGELGAESLDDLAVLAQDWLIDNVEHDLVVLRAPDGAFLGVIMANERRNQIEVYV